MVKCSEVLQCTDVLLVIFYRFVYGRVFCIFLFNSVSYVFLLCLCILIDMYPDRFFRAFSPVVRQMPGYTHKDGARSAVFLISELCYSMYCVNCVVLCIVCV